MPVVPQAPAGVPLVQHSLLLMLQYVQEGRISIEKVVQKMAHAPADCFRIKDRGFIREGFAADLVLVDLQSGTEVTKSNILYKCGWSPFEGHRFPARITHTLVNGTVVYENGQVLESLAGQRLQFER